MDSVAIRRLEAADPEMIEEAFRKQGWSKPASQYLRYLAEQEEGARAVLVAEYEGAFAGYATIKWASAYEAFREREIPEVNDFNVLLRYRRLGIGTMLMEEAERLIAERSSLAGLGVGLYADYGAAQVLYARRGYVPDGRGIQWQNRSVEPGASIPIDDDAVLYLIKQLN
ncbi:N-acetyltransferase [Paenibacillus sp. J31TS4]|uniref:GNAT family N-acetyltransferase n=1 Tax=Paenibacillus sp. J31TS4 TaxID=2807195 RepID=UPI001AFEA22E|nr:GNAT family N-acetyltransferase [Paenibacillus sp. J31TS4]GIP36969.1 N-acetyltransferase [Paenibacillus sp. J31TS4]